jgi:hypothetical protein
MLLIKDFSVLLTRPVRGTDSQDRYSNSSRHMTSSVYSTSGNEFKVSTQAFISSSDSARQTNG